VYELVEVECGRERERGRGREEREMSNVNEMDGCPTEELVSIQTPEARTMASPGLEKYHQ
jgi:hypothetical protein